MISLPLLLLAALPPINSLPEALAQLGSPEKVEALANVDKACKGKLRHELRDNAALKGALEKTFAEGDAAVKNAVLDTGKCFTPAKFVPFVETGLRDADPAVIAHAAEAAARLEDASAAAPLLAALEPRKAACAGEGLEVKQVDVCVWLTYALGPSVRRADAATKARVKELVTPFAKAPYPKLKEVAAETLKQAR